MPYLKEYDLSEKVAIVTGSSRGIGKDIALTLAEAGADIAAVARSEEDIEQTAEEVRQLGRKGIAIPTDITRPDQVQNTVDRVLAEFGKIDILVNNAGAEIDKPVAPMPHLKLPQMTLEEWHRVMDTNVTAPFLLCQAVGPHMIERKQGKVINITSGVAGRVGILYNTAYVASKGALSLFTRKLAWEWSRYNINVNAIGPGGVETEMAAPLFTPEAKPFLEKILSQVPFHRFAKPRDISLLAVYLASDASNFVTGQNIYVDGGFTGSG
ncbi:MAG: 3-oxoacyl-ACP reductase family protein [Dehalococcoidia bacterium]